MRLPLLLALLALLPGCAGQHREADRPYTAGLAQVESVEIEVRSIVPAAAWAWVRGALPDPCTAIDAPDVRRSGSVFQVVLATRRPFGARCEPLATRFEERIRLDVDPEISGAYVVTVNGVSQSFAVNVLGGSPCCSQRRSSTVCVVPRMRHEAPRLARVALVLALLTPLPAHAQEVEPSTGYSAVTGLGSTVCTLVYTPLKLVYAVGGSVVSGLAWMWTLGDKEIAGPIFNSSVRGDYVVTPGNLEGRDELHFVGPQY